MHSVARDANQDRVGFLPIDVVRDLDASWLDETTCRMWVLLRLHHGGACCPGCGCPITSDQRLAFSQFKRIVCGSCGKYFTALSGTFLSGIQGDLRQPIMMAYLIGLGLPDSAIADQLGVARSSVWRFRKKFEAKDG